MSELILGQVISLTGEAADKLLAAGSGDAALLCLALLRQGEREGARKALGWTEARLGEAWKQLAALGLVPDSAPLPPPSLPLEPEGPPDYLRADIMRALEGEPAFQGLYRAVERRLGKKLSDADLKSLYEIYDHVGLPPEVILLLVTHCTEEYAERYGPGRSPRMPQIKKAAYAWRRMGVDTAEGAEEYLKAQAKLRGREKEILPLLDITGRPAVDRERDYLDAWVEMGFPNDVIRLAYEKTVLKKQSLHWGYMNSILKSWHSKGLHTVADIQAHDCAPGRRRATAPSAPQPSSDRLRRDMEWLERFAKENDRR